MIYCILKRRSPFDNYNRDFIAFVDKYIKSLGQYKLILGDFEPSNITIENNSIYIWDPDMLKMCLESSVEGCNNYHILILKKEQSNFYNFSKTDLSENFAIFNQLKIIYLEDNIDIDKDYDTVYKDYIIHKEDLKNLYLKIKE